MPVSPPVNTLADAFTLCYFLSRAAVTAALHVPPHLHSPPTAPGPPPTGKRVVVLGQLPSGLLLVTGPYVINGVPVRRVNQSYVIATSTKVELPQGLDLAKFNDAYFTKDKSSSRKGTEGEFFDKESKPAKKELPAERAQDQKALDKQVLGAVKQTPVLAKYLAASFGLSKGEFPHLLKF